MGKTDKPVSDQRGLAPVEQALTGKGADRKAVEQARDARDAHGQIEGVGDNALVRLSEITNRKVSLQSVARWGGDMAKSGLRRVLAPVTPSKAPSNTPWAKLLRRVALRGMVDGVYRQDGEIIYAGTSDNLLETAFKAGKDLSRLDAYGVRLRKAALAGAKLGEADFRDSVLGYVDFSRADLKRARFARAKIMGWYSPGDRWDRKALVTSMRGADLEQADFRKSTLVGVDFGNARLKGADFTAAKFEDFSTIRDKDEAFMAGSFSIFVITIPIFAAVGMYKDAFKRDRCRMNFAGADLDGARFSVNAPFARLGLSAQQRAQITLVDRRGDVRPDLGIAEDGSLYLKEIGKAAGADKPALTGGTGPG